MSGLPRTEAWTVSARPRQWSCARVPRPAWPKCSVPRKCWPERQARCGCRAMTSWGRCCWRGPTARCCARRAWGPSAPSWKRRAACGWRPSPACSSWPARMGAYCARSPIHPALPRSSACAPGCSRPMAASGACSAAPAFSSIATGPGGANRCCPMAARKCRWRCWPTRPGACGYRMPMAASPCWNGGGCTPSVPRRAWTWARFPC
ncbi:hypothetical protein JANLI_10250 [Janthinobacterium lividum]|nr:hypothetical protein JANLI_10250 [Janthinobacterium lividum]